VVEDSYTDYVPSGHPGARAPHVWLDRGGERLSTIDLVGPEFSLIAGSKGRDWEKVVADVGEKTGLALQCHVIGDKLVDVEGTFNDRFGIGDTGAVLVRPDGFIAWRMQQLGPNAAADLGNALASILS
jgi:aklavinone 12-hydroxylase